MGKSVIKNFVNVAGGTFLTLVIGVLTTPIITRLVNPNDYGRLSLFTMYANILMMILGLGLDQSLVRFFYKSDHQDYKNKLLHECIKIPIIITLCICGIIIFISNIITNQFKVPLAIQIVFCIHVLGLLLNRFAILLLRLQYKTRLYAILNITQKLAYVILALILIKSKNENYFFMLVIATVLANLIVTFIAIIFERNIWSSKKRSKEYKINIKELVTFGVPFIFSFGITLLFQSLDKISLSYFCSIDEVGIYSSAMSLVNIFAIIQTSFNALWTPMVMEHYGKNPNDKNFYIKGNEIIAVLMFGMGCILILCKDIFALLLGEQYRLVAYIIPFLIFNPIMYTISETTVIGILFTKKSKYNIYIALGACICNFVGNIVFIPMLGAKGAALSTGISYIIFFILRSWFSNKLYKIDFKLNKIYAITVSTLIFSLYNTFNKYDFVSFIMFILNIAIIYILYKSTIHDCISYIVKFVNNKRSIINFRLR